MPLFEVEAAEALVPFRQLTGGAELYESEVEDLLWHNLEELTGEALFRVRRQADLPGGGRPDVIALDGQGAVVVIEVKRDVDRKQLAQCLEYAGWARTTNLDELAGLYHLGHEAFWQNWLDFTESAVPVRVVRRPRLFLVARDFHGRTASAFEYLIEHGLPVRLIRVAVYEDAQGRRFVDVEGDHEPDVVVPGQTEQPPLTLNGRRVLIADLVEAGLLTVGEELVWDRPRLGQTYKATVAENGALVLPDGRSFSSPSRAAMEAAAIPSFDGWLAWRVAPDGPLLKDLRRNLLDLLREAEEDALATDVGQKEAPVPTL